MREIAQMNWMEKIETMSGQLKLIVDRLSLVQLWQRTLDWAIPATDIYQFI